jgi:broad specificity phosphatase PhoE
MTTLLLIRHGESEGNLLRYLAGHMDSPLSEKGLAQAKLTAKFIAENYKVDAIYASDLKRAYNTAEEFSKLVDLPIHKEQGLREINAGERTGILYDDYAKQFPEEYTIWKTDAGKLSFPNGESVVQMADRFWKKLEEIAKENDGKTVAVFSHATTIKSVYCRLLGIDILDMQKAPWGDNASVNVLTMYEGKGKLVEWNIVRHIGELLTGVRI